MQRLRARPFLLCSSSLTAFLPCASPSPPPSGAPTPLYHPPRPPAGPWHSTPQTAKARSKHPRANGRGRAPPLRRAPAQRCWPHGRSFAPSNFFRGACVRPAPAHCTNHRRWIQNRSCTQLCTPLSPRGAHARVYVYLNFVVGVAFLVSLYSSNVSSQRLSVFATKLAARSPFVRCLLASGSIVI